MTSKSIIQITVSTHFPIKLTPTNFPVWRKQVESTLIGLELDHFLTESNPPKQSIADADGGSKSNPEYPLWYRQDQIIISAILGSLSDPIQPLISSAATAHDAWVRLNSSFASASRSRIISLKSKLVKNPKGNRTITEYLQDMRSIADDLALAQSPVSEEDLLVHVLSQLGEEYGSIVAAIKIRETPLSYPELFDKLLDFERALKEASPSPDSFPATVNYTAKQQGRPSYRSHTDGSHLGTRPSRFSRNNNNSRRDQQNHSGGIVHIVPMSTVNFATSLGTTLWTAGSFLGYCVTTTS